MTNHQFRFLTDSYLRIGFILVLIGGIPFIYGGSPSVSKFIVDTLEFKESKPLPNLLPDYIMIICGIIVGIGAFFIIREDYGI